MRGYVMRSMWNRAERHCIAPHSLVVLSALSSTAEDALPGSPALGRSMQ